MIRSEFQPQTWTAFWCVIVEQHAAADVAGDLGVSVWTIYKAKARILNRLRDHLSGLLD